VPVDVVGKLHRLTARHHHRSHVEQDDRQRACEFDTPRRLACHRGFDALARPPLFMLEHPLRERDRILHLHAAMAEIAPRAAEQLCRRRVVQVDVGVVRKDELHAPERVLRSGPLPKPQAPCT